MQISEELIFRENFCRTTKNQVDRQSNQYTLKYFSQILVLITTCLMKLPHLSSSYSVAQIDWLY